MANPEVEVEALRRMTPEQKLAVMRSLIRQAYALKAAGIRALHPELPEQEVQARTRAAVSAAIPTTRWDQTPDPHARGSER